MYRSENLFTNKSKKIEINLSEQFFPSLTAEKKEDLNNSDIKKNISYIDKLNMMVEEEEKEDILKPGWVKIYLDKNNKIRQIYNNSEEKSVEKIDEMIMFRKNIQPMFDRWENYKKTYIENNGEDDYYYHHMIPNYDYSYLFKNEEEDDFSDYEMQYSIDEDLDY